MEQSECVPWHMHPPNDWCPTAPHVVPLAAGGAPLDVGNLAVLCRSCNSTKGDGSRDRWGGPLGARLAPDREPLDLARKSHRMLAEEAALAEAREGGLGTVENVGG